MGLRDLVKKTRDTQYHFFSGKGGVGKTSCAAATALAFAKDGRKTLIISIDPAHSLSDSFDMKIGGEVKKLGKNLFGLEIDPAKSMEEYKERFSADLGKMDMLKGLGLDDTFDIAGMTPGIDEVAAFDKFVQYMQNREYDVIIFDTAPTGHALRFLSLPDVLDSWVGKMIKLKMKFSGITDLIKKALPFGEEKEEKAIKPDQLEAMKKRIGEAKKILSDPIKTSFNFVMIPEAMSILETERSMECLEEYGIPVKKIIVNQIIPENPGCKFCTEKRKLQLEKVGEIKERFKGFNINQLHLFKEEVRGLKMLERVGKVLHGSGR